MLHVLRLNSLNISSWHDEFEERNVAQVDDIFI